LEARGLKIRVLKENSCPAPVLEGEYFLARGRFEILGKYPKTPKTTRFWVRLMDFWPESPASGVEKAFSVSFGLVETRNPLFYTRGQPPRPGDCPAHFFYVQNAP
jgi:hypothetical protein